MSQGTEVDLKELVLSNATFGPQEIESLRNAIASDFRRYRLLREAVQELETNEQPSPASNVRLGVCYYLLGHFRLARETLTQADGGALAQFYLAKSSFAQQQYSDAIEYYQAAAKAGYDADQCALGVAEAQRNAGDLKSSLATLDNLSGAVEQTAEYLFQRGATVHAIGGNPEEVVALFERAVESDPSHAGALFGLALEHDRRGNDERAIQFYERSAARIPTHVGTLLNMGVLYEDRLEYDRAQRCYQRILDVYPSHGRARLFLRDAQASGTMYYDEDAQKRRDRLSHILSVPVTDFELSVRSRNCLQKMGLNTLGDLTRTTEQDLLASKNFGETSLVEIKEMLASKDLELGQFAGESAGPEVGYELDAMTPDEQALLNKPIADLNLSVRARKCMIRLGVSTIGELVRKTGDELLEVKNFGVTSLNEVRERLGPLGLKLRGD